MIANKDEIVRETDLYDLCQYLGIDMIDGGNIVKIRCPLHNDRHIGNCWFKRGDGHFFCHACNEGGDAATLVMAALGSSFREAIFYLAEFNGISIVEEKEKQNAFFDKIRPLSAADAKFIGLKIRPVKAVNSVSKESGADCVFNSIYDDDFVKLDTVYSNPLKALYKADFDTYCEIVRNAALKTIEKLKAIRDSDKWESLKENAYEASRPLIEKATQIYIDHGGKFERENSPSENIKMPELWTADVPF